MPSARDEQRAARAATAKDTQAPRVHPDEAM